MLSKRIIPCLDVNNGRVVKGVSFVNLIDAADPVEAAKAYNKQGADELVLLDITASHENRNTMLDIVEKVAKECFIPFTVGGGIKSVDDIKKTLRAGADKISLNSAAVKDPELVKNGANAFGSQCITVAIDVKSDDSGKYNVYINGGRINTNLDAVEWAKKVESLGAGEILLTSMDKDGQKTGYDLVITEKIANAVNIPVIASGGAGKLEHFLEALKVCDAALAASLFHFGTLKVPEVKKYLKDNGIDVRM